MNLNNNCKYLFHDRTVFGGTVGPNSITTATGETQQAYIGIRARNPQNRPNPPAGPSSPILKAQLTNKPGTVEVKPVVVQAQHKGNRVNSSHLISSHLISSHLISSHLISSHLISSHLISPHLISSPLISSHPISSHLISSHSIPSHPISSHFI
ncbi:hypothetical protein RR48_05810 [Papilio machaon]|uniref:Uncharacterized protein n=1 Tax=Papilio machaon TaxID=76193 RepID=A0A0N0PE21_PAPMA|nr:hypothetical protein RR48_05810 [Papilio machaon]